MGSKTSMMQDLGFIDVEGYHNSTCRFGYQSAHKGAAIKLLPPMSPPVFSGLHTVSIGKKSDQKVGTL